MKKRALSILLAAALLIVVFIPANAATARQFKDVKRGDWYYEAVDFVVSQGLFAGTSNTTFSPNARMTRGMLVTVLGRNSNVDTAQYQFARPLFTDVSTSMYYSPYINWGHVCGIVSGVGDGKFKPNYYLSREQLVTLFYRYAEAVGFDTAILDESFYTFEDWDSVSDYAVEPMRWAVSHGCINGNDKNELNPFEVASRAMVAQVLYNAADVLYTGKWAPAPTPLPNVELPPLISPTPTPTMKPTATPTPKPPVESVTAGMRNALTKAHSYLNVMNFSYQGLIDQLKYEGFSRSESEYAADHCNANWNDQALGKAKSYLSVIPHSYSGLIEQLKYDKFTEAQATFGAKNCGANWNQQAAKKAKSYLDLMPFSRDGLIGQLEYDGFTHEQAVYGVNSVGL